MYLKLNCKHPFHLWMGCGNGTNTKGELLAISGLLWFVNYKDIVYLQVVSNSKVIMEWEARKSRLHAFSLDHWCSQIVELKKEVLSYLSTTQSGCIKFFKENCGSYGWSDLYINFKELIGNFVWSKGSHYVFFRWFDLNFSDNSLFGFMWSFLNDLIWIFQILSYVVSK